MQVDIITWRSSGWGAISRYFITDGSSREFSLKLWRHVPFVPSAFFHLAGGWNPDVMAGVEADILGHVVTVRIEVSMAAENKIKRDGGLCEAEQPNNPWPTHLGTFTWERNTFVSILFKLLLQCLASLWTVTEQCTIPMSWSVRLKNDGS